MDTTCSDTATRMAARIVQTLGSQPGELVLVRDAAGRMDVLLEVSLAVEMQGATPLIEFVPAEYRQRLWNEVPREYLSHWDRHRSQWLQQADRILVLAGADQDWSMVSREGFLAWQQAVHRLTVAEDARALPCPLVAVPTKARAEQIGLSLESLEAILLPAITASVQELKEQVDGALDAVQGGETITVYSGVDHVLHLQQGDRAWGGGYGAPPSNLPAGHIHTTVLETETEGSLWFPEAGGATDVVFHFVKGRIERIEAANGAEELCGMFDSHSGEPRRVSHIGLGLNPYLRRPIGFALVDECARGAFFIALGENRYMGGQNESSLNVDFCTAGATVEIGDRVLVSEGRLVV